MRRIFVDCGRTGAVLYCRPTRAARAASDGVRSQPRRIEEGTYGECVVCAEPIAPARLQAQPAVTLCLACAEEREQR